MNSDLRLHFSDEAYDLFVDQHLFRLLGLTIRINGKDYKAISLTPGKLHCVIWSNKLNRATRKRKIFSIGWHPNGAESGKYEVVNEIYVY